MQYVEVIQVFLWPTSYHLSTMNKLQTIINGKYAEDKVQHVVSNICMSHMSRQPLVCLLVFVNSNRTFYYQSLSVCKAPCWQVGSVAPYSWNKLCYFCLLTTTKPMECNTHPKARVSNLWVTCRSPGLSMQPFTQLSNFFLLHLLILTVKKCHQNYRWNSLIFSVQKIWRPSFLLATFSISIKTCFYLGEFPTLTQ